MGMGMHATFSISLLDQRQLLPPFHSLYFGKEIRNSSLEVTSKFSFQKLQIFFFRFKNWIKFSLEKTAVMVTLRLSNIQVLI